MKVIVTTSDYYNPIIPAFVHLFVRHWSRTQQVIVLCYSTPKTSLPSNVSAVSVGPPWYCKGDDTEWSPYHRGEGCPNPNWTNSIRPFFEQLTDEYFMLLQIDYFIHKPVAIETITLLESYLQDGTVGKIDLSYDRCQFPHSEFDFRNGVEIIVSDQKAEYRSSLQAAIWRTDYWLKTLRPNRSPWDFEVLGMKEQMGDGMLILGTRPSRSAPVPYLNAYTRGTVNWQQILQMDPMLLAELRETGLIGPHWNGWIEPPAWSAWT